MVRKLSIGISTTIDKESFDIIEKTKKRERHSSNSETIRFIIKKYEYNRHLPKVRVALQNQLRTYEKQLKNAGIIPLTTLEEELENQKDRKGKNDSG